MLHDKHSLPRLPRAAKQIRFPVNGHFRRVRTGNQIRCSQQVQEFGVGHPLPAPDHLILHHRDMRRRPSKRNRAQLQKERSHLVNGTQWATFDFRQETRGTEWNLMFVQ